AMHRLARIEMAKGRLAARGQQKVVRADAVLDDLQHRPRPVRPQAMAGRQPDRLLIIERPAVRQRLARIVGHEGEHVADLAALRVDDPKAVAAGEPEGGAAARRDFGYHAPALGSWKGQAQSSSTARPLY